MTALIFGQLSSGSLSFDALSQIHSHSQHTDSFTIHTNTQIHTQSPKVSPRKGTGKKTPGGAGTYKGHTPWCIGAHWTHRHTDHTDEPHKHHSQATRPTNAHTYKRATSPEPTEPAEPTGPRGRLRKDHPQRHAQRTRPAAASRSQRPERLPARTVGGVLYPRAIAYGPSILKKGKPCRKSARFSSRRCSVQ